jgi:hypothetical protein
MAKKTDLNNLEAAIARIEQKNNCYSPRMQRLIDGIAKLRTYPVIGKPVKFFEKLSESEEIQSFYFGGVLRDVYLGFVPRDLDYVVNSGQWDRFEEATKTFQIKRNRFGGLKLNVFGVSVDAWSVGSTYAFAHEMTLPASPTKLPETTMLNAESIVLEVWAPEGKLWGFEKGFFDACDSKTLEIQNPWNYDFQESSAPLQLGRIYRLQQKLGWNVGPVLKHYIRRHVSTVSPALIKEFYESHYGEACQPDKVIKQLRALTL